MAVSRGSQRMKFAYGTSGGSGEFSAAKDEKNTRPLTWGWESKDSVTLLEVASFAYCIGGVLISTDVVIQLPFDELIISP